MRGRAITLLVLSTGLLLGATSLAVAEDAATLVKEINSELRAAQRTFFNGKHQDALAQVVEIEKKLEKLKALDAENSSLGSLEQKCAKLRADIEKRLPRRQPPPAASPADMPEAGQGDLPAGAARCLRELDTAIAKAQRALDRNKAGSAEQARYEMKSAEMFWSDLEKKYPDSVGHPAAVAAKSRVAGMFAKIEAAERGNAADAERAAAAAAGAEAAAAEWLARMRPFLASRGEEGYDPEHEFVGGYTEEAAEMNRRMRAFAAASALFAEYRKASFPNGKTEELEQTEKELAYRLSSFQENLDSMSELRLREAQAELKRCLDFLAENEERCKDGETMPRMLQQSIVPALEKKLKWVEALLPGDERVAALRAGYAGLLAEQSRWREKFIASTVMLPDKYEGKDADALREKARAVVTGEFEDAEVLRATVISSDWSEESVLEFTDTTRTAVRYRVTRSLTVQVAVRRGDGCYLYSVHLAKDQRSDGSFGALAGHIMFTDRILEENVTKQ